MALNAIFAGVTGLSANSQFLDVVGNNLANSSTTGFKSQRVLFKDLVYQTLNGGSAPSGESGAVNPSQIGFGVSIGSIGSIFQQGTLTPTARNLDVGIQGTGFFVLSDGLRTVYSRAGAFDIDVTGYLIDPGTGMRVQRFGDVGEGAGGFQVPGNPDTRIPLGASNPGFATANVTLQGNLAASMPIGDSVTMASMVYDTQGQTRSFTVTLTRVNATDFSVSATITGGTVTIPPGNIVFNSSGYLVSPSTIAVDFVGLPGPQTVVLNLGTPGNTDGLTLFGGASSAAMIYQDGYGPGTLDSVSIDKSGLVYGLFSNGRTEPLAQLAIARFMGEGGLLREGDNYFRESPSSGPALIGAAGTGGRGTVVSGTLENSNVDIAQEFSRLILAQRGFQINARVITVSNEVLQELSTIIR
jgi:flagellar hook protein FlgE